MCVYLEKGLSSKEIAQLTGRATSGIWYMLHKHGVDMRQQTERIDKEWLRRQYVELRRSTEDIAQELGCVRDRVDYLVRVYEFPRLRPIKRTFRPTREWLWQKYVVEGLSSEEICQLTSYSSTGLIRVLKKHSIPLKGWSLPKLEVTREQLHQWHVVEGLTAVRIAQKVGCHNSAISRLLKKYGIDPGRPLVNIPTVPPLSRDELWKLYWVDKLSTSDIARRYAKGKSTVQRWFKILGVEARRWNGGVVSRTYVRSADPDRRLGREFNAYEREKILQRDGERCQMPGCGGSDQWMLEAHHVIPIENDGDHELTNGLTLCRPCHVSIRNRELQFAPLFQKIIEHNLRSAQTGYIGETPAVDNPDGSSGV